MIEVSKRYCSECNCEITWRGRSGLCKPCRARRMGKAGHNKCKNPMPKYLIFRYYILKKQQEWIREYTVREFGFIIETSQCGYQDGDLVRITANSLIVIRGNEEHEIVVE